MGEPSIKGVLVHGLVEQVREHLERGMISRDELEVRLEKADLELIDEKIIHQVWYPIDAYARIAEVALELKGGSRVEACIRSGESDARRMLEAGLYKQLESLEQMSEAENAPSVEQRFEVLGRLLRLTVSLSKAIYSFSDWKVVPDPDHPWRYRVEVTDAEHLPEMNVIGTVGFLNECSRVARPDGAIQWSFERPRPDLVIYRMNRGYE